MVIGERLQKDIPFVNLTEQEINPGIISRVPAKIVSYYNFMPIRKENNTITIAIDDPMDIRRLDEIKLSLRSDISIVISSPEDIAAAIRQYYGIGAETVEKMLTQHNYQMEIIPIGDKKDEYIQDETIDASIIKFVNQILMQALEDCATDIHFEPFEDEYRVRFRIDGLLYETPIPPSIKQFKSSIVSRLKIMAHLNIAEKRLPQDGRIKIRMNGEEFDLRVSILPTPFGESVDVRILTRNKILLGLEQLGLCPDDLNILNELIKKPHGIILVTGPTGSGKTTTLYACLSRINSMDRKILTIEDPIEYQLRGITQMQVHPKIGLSFSNGLRSMLRHDPDIMMVGEIRDIETSEITIRTALTGHLVFSTLHTNDAAGAIARLMDMGIEPYLISASVEGIIAQRLVRLICLECKESFHASLEVLNRIGNDFQKPKDFLTLYKGKGCSKCKYTGYRGRTGIYELLVINDRIRDLINSRSPAGVIKKTALSIGMKTLRQDGLNKVLNGLTTIEEILRVTQEDTFSMDKE